MVYSKRIGVIRKNAAIDLTGLTFYNWRVIKRVENDRRGNVMWLCICKCGVRKNIASVSLRNGTSKSCGCLQSRESYYATMIKKYLVKRYKARKEWKECVNPITGYHLPYDVYIPIYKLYIEIQGNQHYEIEERYHMTMEDLEYQKYKDNVKKEHAEANGRFIAIRISSYKNHFEAIRDIENYIINIELNGVGYG